MHTPAIYRKANTLWMGRDPGNTPEPPPRLWHPGRPSGSPRLLAQLEEGGCEDSVPLGSCPWLMRGDPVVRAPGHARANELPPERSEPLEPRSHPLRRPCARSLEEAVFVHCKDRRDRTMRASDSGQLVRAREEAEVFGDIADTDGIALPRDKRLGERERGRPARGAPPGEASGEGIDESAGVVMADASSSGSLVTESRSVPAPL